MERIAIIGAGATGTYALAALASSGSASQIVVFESSDLAGPGLAYSKHLNDPHALSNISGIEIPPLFETLNAWAMRQPKSKLDTWGIAETAGDNRAFFPRVVLGAWLADQLALTIEHSDVPITVNLISQVTDVVAWPHGCQVSWRSADDKIFQENFDRVIVASGYGPIAKGDSIGSQSTGKADITPPIGNTPPHVGILGSSLSGIDAVVGIAMERGNFLDTKKKLVYFPDENWRATLFSRNGILPEADFWFPHPLPELEHFTRETAVACVHGEHADLDRLFALFALALETHDPEWSKAIGLSDATVDDFGDRYFAARVSTDPWNYARQNLENVKKWQNNHKTPAWRLVILKAHEVFATVIPRLLPVDLARLHNGLKRVFTDNYAAVPHLSIERILALNAAGILNVVALGNNYEMLPTNHLSWRIKSQNWTGLVDELIDARGPQAAELDHVPFPTLRLQLCATAVAESADWKAGVNPSADLTYGDKDISLKRVHFCALPFLLRNRPFVQGLVECSEIATAVVDSINLEFKSVDDALISTENLIEVLDKPTIILADGAVIALAN